MRRNCQDRQARQDKQERESTRTGAESRPFFFGAQTIADNPEFYITSGDSPLIVLKDAGPTSTMPIERVFNGPMFAYEDDRFRYEEQRLVTLGLFKGIPVSIVHTETKNRIHIISFRKATRRETAILFENL